MRHTSVTHRLLAFLGVCIPCSVEPLRQLRLLPAELGGSSADCFIAGYHSGLPSGFAPTEAHATRVSLFRFRYIVDTLESFQEVQMKEKWGLGWPQEHLVGVCCLTASAAQSIQRG
jgi:hypothetical protein